MKTDNLRTAIGGFMKSKKTCPSREGASPELLESTGFPRIKYGAGLVKQGMIKKVTSLFSGFINIYLLCFCLVFQPAIVQAGPVQIPGFYGSVVVAPAPPRTALPQLQLKNPGVLPAGISALDTSIQNKLVIRQNQPQVIIDWDSFNIGADAWTHFDQQGNAGWAALNRIWDKDPTQIFGKLTADGKIYLINQNGILFGPGSKVNVNTLVASALNIKDDIFKNFDPNYPNNKVLTFQLENYQKDIDSNRVIDPLAIVSNFGEINAGQGVGSIFLIAPRVENYALLNAPLGQIGLVAGTNVALAQPNANDPIHRTKYYVLDDFSNPPSNDPTFGRAVNGGGGELRADGGMVGMYGFNVEQLGVIRAITAFQNKQGQVELRAVNKVTTGDQSSIFLPVDASIDPATGQIVTVSDTFDIQPQVDIGGLHQGTSLGINVGPAVKQIEHRGVIAAPAGQVTMNAAERIYLEKSSSIDVGGVKYLVNLNDGSHDGAGSPVAVNSYRPADVIATSIRDVVLPAPVVLDLKLTSVELRDAYMQKDGLLQGQKITTAFLTGSNIGDLSSFLLAQDRTAVERSIGTVRTTTKADPNNNTTIVYYNTPATGQITLTALAGDIIIKDKASLDFGGGKITYAGGLSGNTKLLSGSTIYDISNAPLSLHYDKVITQQTKTYDRYGIQEKYNGLYLGGANALGTSVTDGYYKVGGNAGGLALQAAVIVLDGQLNGSVTIGDFQNAWTVPGSFSGASAASNFDQAMALSVRRGLEAPRAGVLTINTDNDKSTGSSIEIIAETKSRTDIQMETPLDTKTTTLSAKTLNDAKLSQLNLTANLNISTAPDAAIGLQPGGWFAAQARRIWHQGSITVPGGSIALSIVQNITSKMLAGGTANDPVNWIDLQERIILGQKSSLDVAGEKIDNSLAGKTGAVSPGFAQKAGGSIYIFDKTDDGDGVFIPAGAKVDVSGGYVIDRKGTVAGGNAGVLSIQGSNIMLDGDLRGHALSDANGKILGGAITLAASDIHVVSKGKGDDWSGFNPELDPVTDSPGKRYKDKFSLAENRLDDTGFAQITLNSLNDVVFDPDATLQTSLARLKNPAPSRQTGTGNAPAMASSTGSAIQDRPDLFRLKDSLAFMAGPSTFSVAAGTMFEGNNAAFTGNLRPVNPDSRAKIVIPHGAVVRTAPAGSSVTRIVIANNDAKTSSATDVGTNITLTAPYVAVAGKLESRGGDISVTATGINNPLTPLIPSLLIDNGAQILAGGYYRSNPAATSNGSAVNNMAVLVAGGSVALSAANGDLTLAEGAEIDISGSEPVVSRWQSVNGQIFTFREAGNPGSLSLTSHGNPTWKGKVKAGARMAGIQGATLSINTDAVLDVRPADIANYRNLGFDDLTLKSSSSLFFSQALDEKIGRKLTLDAPVINGAGQDVTLSAPWIILTNSNPTLLPVSPSPAPATGSLALSGASWIDVIGSVNIGGFQRVMLQAKRDIRLSEALYNNNMRAGMLAATGNLMLDADQTYPGSFYSYASDKATKLVNNIFLGTYSDFTIHAGKKVTVQHTGGHIGGPVYSAGGSLLVTAGEGIEVAQGGYLAAPMGNIKLSAPGKRIYLAEGSVLTTAGNPDTGVNYGAIDENSQLWITGDKTFSNSKIPVNEDSFAGKGIDLNADTVIVRDGAQLNINGGGKVFAYKFQPGITGSTDPLAKANRYVVFKDTTFALPGTKVHLKAGGGLDEGDYTLLPLDAKNPQNARYAFLPGAYILEKQTSAALPGSSAVSRDGYPLTIGFTGVADTPVAGTRPQIYSVRTAAAVLQTEGTYLQPSLVSGNAGNIGITGNTVILGDALKAQALPGFQGGTISLSATNVIVKQFVGNILGNSNFGFNTPVADIDPGLEGKLTLSGESLSGKGFSKITLGDKDSTKSVTIESGTADNPTALEAAGISLNAREKIDIQKNTRLTASTTKDKDSEEGVIELTTPGALLVDENAVIHATHSISLDVTDVKDIKGNLQVDNSAITLKSENIYFGEKTASGATGLHVTAGDATVNDAGVWKRLLGFENITFTGKKNIQFWGDTNLSAPGSLTLDTAGILDMKTNGASTVTMTASVVNIRNSAAATSTATAPTAQDGKTEKGTFTVNAGSQINIGGGDVFFDGFKTINFTAANDLAFVGKGRLTTGNTNIPIAGRSSADLNIKAARVITMAGSSSAKGYVAPNFNVDAGTGLIAMNGSGAAPAATPVPGGLLEITGKSIRLSTVLQSDGGTIKLTSTGASADGIVLDDGGKILAPGTDDAPGGQVILSANNSSIALDAGSVIDVSAGSQGDAGTVNLSAPVGGVTVNGILKGAAKDTLDAQGNILRKGRGGSFILHTNRINDFTGLNNKLTAGGFAGNIDLRVRLGNIDIAADQTLTARHVKLTADEQTGGQGQINVSGTIDASSYADGIVELYAMNDLSIFDGGAVRGGAPANAYPNGWSVLLSSAQGFVNVNSGGKVDGGGGNIYLRAKRTGTDDLSGDVKINLANGSLTGAPAVYAEAFWSYTGSSFSQTWLDNADTFYNNSVGTGRAVTRLEGSAPGGAATFHLLPGIEWTNPGDITVASAIDFTSPAHNRYQTQHDLDIGKTGKESGVLTIRTPNNLNISSKLVDYPTANRDNLAASSVRDSWGFNLVAGADTGSADYLAVNKTNTGNLTIAGNTVVYTESAPLRFASGGNTVIGSGFNAGYMINTAIKYNLATYDSSIRGYVGRDLIINGGAIQSATGDISIDVGGSLQLNGTGGSAIRTTGQTTATGNITIGNQTQYTKLQQYWTYAGGGDINLNVYGNIGSLDSSGQWGQAVNSDQWDYFNPIATGTLFAKKYYARFSARYDNNATAGIAAMGGGSVLVRTGGDFLAQTGAFGTGGWDNQISTNADNAFKGGDLAVYAGGNIRGRFLNMNGYGELHALGNFGAFEDTPSNRVQIELFNSKFNVTALGEIQIAAVVNPSLASDKNLYYNNNTTNKNQYVDCTYTPDTLISLKAGTDVTIAGKSAIYNNTTENHNSTTETILPAAVNVEAGENIYLLNNFTLASSPAGNLRLVADRGDITSGSDTAATREILVSDIATQYWYGHFTTDITKGGETRSDWISKRAVADSAVPNSGKNFHNYYKDSNLQAISSPLHYGDSQSIEISAGRDIKNLLMFFPKKASVTAKRDILNITYEGQNLHPEDVSAIRAGRDISMASYVRSLPPSNAEYLEGLVQGGPGVFLVQAGRAIDLGTLTDGIQTVGNGRYPQLGTGESSLVIVAGYNFDKEAADVGAFFANIQKAGDEYAREMAAGRLEEAASLLKDTREENSLFLGQSSGKGDINMSYSQIGTSVGKSDIFIIAAGEMNLGKSALPVAGTLSNKTGITTGGGGAINIFALGDVNVNESRVMTFFSRDDIRKQVEGLNLGALKETVVDKLAAVKNDSAGRALEDFLASADARDLSESQKVRLEAVKEKVAALGDITIWADQGNINAGRGSRTAVSASPPKVNDDGTQAFSPPSIGSGIRAVTYGDNAPPQGNVHLFAPEGIIDAGEAGIAGGKIVLVATQVLNSSNISFTAGSVGVSATAGATASLGALSGSGSAMQSNQLMSDAAGIGSAGAAKAASMIEDILTKWLDVKVIDFILE